MATFWRAQTLWLIALIAGACQTGSGLPGSTGRVLSMTKQLTPADYHHRDLSDLLRTPKAYLTQRVQFQVYYARRGDMYQVYYTPFHEADYVNFYVWDEGARLWQPEVYRAVYPLLYISRDQDQLLRRLNSLDKFMTIRIYGLVKSAYGNKPWIKVEDFEISPGAKNYSDRALKHISIGMSMARKGEHDLAQRRLMQALNEDLPPAAETEVKRTAGIVLFELGRYEEAKRFMKEALGEEADPALRLKLGEAYLELAIRHGLPREQLVDARDQLEDVVREDPGEIKALASLGLAYGYLAKIEQATKARRELFKLAARNCQDALRQKPTDDRSMRNLGLIYKIQGRVENNPRRIQDAIRQYENAILIRPDSRLYHRELGLLYLEENDYARAETEFRGILDLNPEDHEFYILRARARVARGNIDGAEKDCQNAIQIKEDYREAHKFYAEVLARKKKFAAALEEMDKVVDLDRDDPEGHLDRARFLRRQNKFEDAIKRLKKDILADASMASHHPEARYELARIYFEQEQPDFTSAISQMQQMIAARPGHLDARYHQAGNFLETGQFKKARVQLEIVKDKTPQNLPARLRLGIVYHESGYPSKAESEFQAVIAGDEKNAEARYLLARVLIDDKPKESFDLALQALRLDGENQKLDHLEYTGLLAFAAHKARKPFRAGIDEFLDQVAPALKAVAGGGSYRIDVFLDQAARAQTDRHFVHYYKFVWVMDQKSPKLLRAYQALAAARKALEVRQEARPGRTRASAPIKALRRNLESAEKRLRKHYKKLGQAYPG